MALNARQLEIFREVVRSGSLTAAAKVLNVSQPAAGKVLRHMETTLGYPLFERIGGRLVPTAEAELLFPEADRVFREIEAVREFSRQLRDNRGGLLRIGASAPPTFTLVPAAIAAFKAQRRTRVKIVLRTLPAAELSEQVFLGELDFALSLSPSTRSSIKSEVMGTVEVVAVMPEGHPLAAKEVIRVKDLADEELISYGSHAEIGGQLDRAFESQGAVRRVGLEVSFAISAVPLVKAGLGIALVDGMSPWTDFKGVTTRRFEPQVLMGLHLLTNDGRPLQRLAKEFIAVIPKTIRTRGG